MDTIRDDCRISIIQVNALNRGLLYNRLILSIAIRIVALPIVNYLHFVSLHEEIYFVVGLAELKFIVASIDENLENCFLGLKFNLLRLVYAKK